MNWLQILNNTFAQILAPATQDQRLYAVGSALERELASRWGGHLLDRVPELATTGVEVTK